MDFARRHWDDAWSALRVSPPPALAQQLAASYAEPHRAYHTHQHLQECFEQLDALEDMAMSLSAVRLALWFHDAIYDTQRNDNEDASAAWAERALHDAGVDAVTVAAVRSLVLVTKHDALAKHPDEMLLNDIDLAILGAAAPRFREYESQVRAEYAWVADDVFRVARAQVLQAFLDRPAIYCTSVVRERLEPRARENLERSVRALQGP